MNETNSGEFRPEEKIEYQKNIYLIKKVYEMDKNFIKEGKSLTEDYPAKKHHPTFESAYEEAKRLHSLHGGSYMVFKSVYYINSVVVTKEGDRFED